MYQYIKDMYIQRCKWCGEECINGEFCDIDCWMEYEFSVWMDHQRWEAECYEMQSVQC